MFFGGRIGGGSGSMGWAEAQRNVAIGRVFSWAAPLLLRRFRGGQRARLQRLERAVIIVQDIVVDISFNQLGGLSTLCFLEKVLLKVTS